MFEAAGVAIFALTGAIVAGRKGMDPFGFILLATVTGVGGGTLRDVLLGNSAFWVSDPIDVAVCVVVALCAWTTAGVPGARSTSIVKEARYAHNP